VSTTIPTGGTVTVQNGFSGGAVKCTLATDPACKNIVSTYTVSDTADLGQLVNLDNEKAPLSGFAPLSLLQPLTTYPFQCFEASLTTADTAAVIDGGLSACGPSGKVVRSTYPVNVGLHLETDQYDTSITTAKLGAPCLALQTVAFSGVQVLPTDSHGNLKLVCTNPNFATHLDANGNPTNLCPDGGPGWTATKPCAYIYYEDVQNKPTRMTALIGSSISGGINVKRGNGTIAKLVPPWCTGKFPFTAFFQSWPQNNGNCVFKYMWLNKSTQSGNNDIQVQSYIAGDQLRTGGGG
jgi:hypothetical protein